MGSSFPIVFLLGPSYYFTAFIISQSGSFALVAVMGDTGIALLTHFTLTHWLQWTLCFQARG